jgi:RNA-directed DNA polymerase
VLLRLIGKWLRAGVLEEGTWTTREAGSPQGGVISPALANVYLHYVLDVWFEQVVKPRLWGRAFLTRYADDLVMGFACEEDSCRVLEVLPRRFGKYGLTLHPVKTRLVSFGRPAGSRTQTDSGQGGKPGTFEFLGFTHYWGRSRKGYWVVKRKTASCRLSRALRSIVLWCRANRHRPVREQCQTLSRKLSGHFAYFGITGNSEALRRFRHEVVCIWRKWLSRRRRCGSLPWPQFMELLKRYPLPPAVATHSVCRRIDETPT